MTSVGLCSGFVPRADSGELLGSRLAKLSPSPRRDCSFCSGLALVGGQIHIPHPTITQRWYMGGQNPLQGHVFLQRMGTHPPGV